MLDPYMRYAPMAALAAVLLIVAWYISEYEHFRHTLSAPKCDRPVPCLGLPFPPACEAATDFVGAAL